MPSALTVTLVQSTFLTTLANLLAQFISQYKNHVSHPVNTTDHLTRKKPFTLNIFALLQFLTYNLIVVPPNFSWQRWLETRYPGFPTAKCSDQGDLLPREEKAKGDDDNPAASQSTSGRRRWRSFAAKFILDQSVASMVNVLLFLVLINLLKGLPLSRVWELVCEVSAPSPYPPRRFSCQPLLAC